MRVTDHTSCHTFVPGGYWVSGVCGSNGSSSAFTSTVPFSKTPSHISFRVAKYRNCVAVRELRARHEALLLLATVPAEDHRTWRWGKQPCDCTCEMKLLVLHEEVEDHGDVYGGKLARKRGERCQLGKIRWRALDIGRLVDWRYDIEERRVQNVAFNEGDRELLWRIVK